MMDLITVNLAEARQTSGAASSSGIGDSSKVYDLQEVVITAQRQNEERLVGPYGQPQWTTLRRFPSTRVYVQTLPGRAEFEQ